jgi:hypothetical protein
MFYPAGELQNLGIEYFIFNNACISNYLILRENPHISKCSSND